MHRSIRERTRGGAYAQNNSSFRKVVKIAGKKLWKILKAAVPSFFWAFVCKFQTLVREGDQAGLYKPRKAMTLEGRKAAA